MARKSKSTIIVDTILILLRKLVMVDDIQLSEQTKQVISQLMIAIIRDIAPEELDRAIDDIKFILR